MNVTKMLQEQVHAGWLLYNTQMPQNDCLHLGSCCQLNCNRVFQRELLTLLWLCHRAFILRGIKLGVTSLQLHLSFQTGRWPRGGRALGGRAAPIPSRPMVEVGKTDEQQREGRTDCEQKQPGFRVPFHTQKALCFLVFPLLQPCLNPG